MFAISVKETAINQRIDQHGKTVGLLFPLMKDEYVPRESKVVICNIMLRPILMHGCEAWKLNMNYEKENST